MDLEFMEYLAEHGYDTSSIGLHDDAEGLVGGHHDGKMEKDGTMVHEHSVGDKGAM
jgi:hypothetical protein